MHVAQAEFGRGQVTLTVDYRTNEGTRRVIVNFTGDDVGLRDDDNGSLPARDEALKLLSEFVDTAAVDFKANRVRWRGI